MKRLACAILACVLALPVFSCAHFGMGAKAPEVTISDIKVDQVTLFETSFTVKLRVVNKNPAALDVAGSEGDVYLNNSKILTVVSADAQSIPGLGSSIIEAKAHASNIRILPFMADLIGQLQAGGVIKDVDYKATGTLHLTGGSFLSGRVPFKATGVLPFSMVQNMQSNLLKSGITVPMIPQQ